MLGNLACPAAATNGTFDGFAEILAQAPLPEPSSLPGR